MVAAGPSRTLLAAAAAAAALAAPGPARPDPAGFRSVAVDVRPLLGQGLGSYAEEVRAVLEGELRQALAGRTGRGDRRLVVRIDGISLRSYVGGGSARLGGSGLQNDYLEGEALVLGRRGEVLARRPQLSAVPSSSGGAWYLPDGESRRLRALAAHFAAWLGRALD